MSDERSMRYFGQILVTLLCVITAKHRSEIMVLEIFFDPNSYLVERQDPDELFLFPDAENVRVSNNRICLVAPS